MSVPNRRKARSMLECVVAAIVEINDPHGSNTRSIVRHINCTVANKFPNGQNGVTMQVRKALKQGSESGLLIHLAGKYKLSVGRQKNKYLANYLIKPTIKPKSTALKKKSNNKAYSGKVQTLCRGTNYSSRKIACCNKRRPKKQMQKRSRRKGRCHSFVAESGNTTNNGNNPDKKFSSRSSSKSNNDIDNSGDDIKTTLKKPRKPKLPTPEQED